MLVFIFVALVVAVVVVYRIRVMWTPSAWTRIAREVAAEEPFDDDATDLPSQVLGGRWDRYWARRLRTEMGYPTNCSVANRMVALNKLQTMWREECPDLRECDKMHHAHRVVAMSFIPSNDEVESARIAASVGATKLQEEISHPVVGYGFFGGAIRAKVSDF